MTEGGIDAWVARERLRILYRGVYAIGHEPLTRHGWVMAAVLASGPGAVVSHRTAAWVWGVLRDERAVVDVTVPRRRRGQRGIAVHESRLADRDQGCVDAIPVTSLPRTLLDVAEVVTKRDLARALEEAERARLFDLGAVEDVIARGVGRRGVGRLRAALVSAHEPAITRSELERRFIELIRQAGLPLPSQNAYVRGFEVDAVWPAKKLVVELDGYEYHRTRQAFERDRERDARFHAEGWTVLRFSWRQVVHEPETVVAALRTTLTQP